MTIAAPASHGELYEKLVTQYTTGCELVEKGLVEVHPTNTMADEFTVILRTAKDLDADYSANPVAKSTADIKYEGLVTKLGKTMLYYDKIRPQEFENVWRKYQPTGDFSKENLSSEILADLFALVGEQYGEVANDLTVNGTQTDSDIVGEKRRYNGVMTQAKAAGSKVKKVAGATAVVTSADAVAVLEKLYQTTAVRVRRQRNFKFAVSTHILDLYHQSQYNADFKGVSMTEEGVSKYRGKEVHSIDTLGDNEGFAGVMSPDTDSNLIMPVAGVTQSSILLDKVTNMGENWALKIIWKQGLAIKKQAELTIYSFVAPTASV